MTAPAPLLPDQGALRDSELSPRLLVIQRGQSHSPFFCIGGGPRYYMLARLLGSDQPFLAPLYPKPSALPRPCRIEDIARYHVNTICSAQPTGPYVLGGWCIDGLVAYEVAQQLKAAGKQVALLVLFDASLYSESQGRIIYSWLEAIAGSIGFHLQVIFKRLRWSEVPTYVFRHIRRVEERIQAWWLSRNFYRQSSNIERLRWEVRQISAIQHRVAPLYRLRPYDGPVLLLCRSARRTRRTEAAQDWGRVVRGPLEVHTIDGDHSDMFEQPQVAITAEKLRDCLQRMAAVATTCQDSNKPCFQEVPPLRRPAAATPKSSRRGGARQPRALPTSS
jgi:thioesterase domain-containing protein